VRHNADPLLSAFKPVRSGKITSITTTSAILLQSIPHLYKLAQYPVVIHVSLQGDYSDITAIRQTGFSFLQSETLQEAQDIALSAHALAIKSGKGVIHFFNSESIAKFDPITVESRDLVRQVLDLDAVRRFQEAATGDSTIYADDGRKATLTVPVLEAPSANGAGTNGATNGANTPLEKQASGQASARDSSTESSRRESSADSAPSSVTSVESMVSRPVTSDDILNFTTQIWNTIKDVTGREYHPFSYFGSPKAQSALFVFGAESAVFAREILSASSSDQYANAAVITARLYRPWLGATLSSSLPKSIKRIAVLEQIRRKTTKWGPLLLDILMSLKSSGNSGPVIVGYQLGYVEASTARSALRTVFQNLTSDSPVQNLEIGTTEAPKTEETGSPLEQPAVENAYMKILNQLFGQRLYVANKLGSNSVGIPSSISSTPEFGFGSLVARQERRKEFILEAQQAAKERNFVTDIPRDWLSKWALLADDVTKVDALATGLVARLSVDGSALASKFLSEKALFPKESQWLIGSDAWAYDLGNSGVHHVLASGKNVNMLIIDSQPYSERASADATRRKKDIGLYAMNFGNAYVASVAVYSSYTQVLAAMLEAERFNGPSVVLAYLPYFKENDTPLNVLQETKKAVDIGYWPLYRWNPTAEEDRFQLDSERVKKELEEFLRRDNYLTQVTKRYPEFANNLAGSYGSEVRDLQKRRAKDAYNQLLEGLQGAPVTILFASDNGNAEKMAKRIGNRGKARGLKTMVMAMDDYPLEDLAGEENVVVVTSTAGQGEIPQNGRQFWENIRNSTDIDLATVKFAVFALGDKHYWPRKEDRIYFNKPGKDIHARFLALGGQPMTDIGMGDDQDPDGPETGYAEWEPKLWQALDVDKVEGIVEEEESKVSINEVYKIESNFLRGNIAEELEDTSTGAINDANQQLTKFHGTYMQDDRDIRQAREDQGLEPAYSFMIRCRLAGGVATPKQWLQMDEISSTLGNETMKLTTRQTFQFHGVVKGKLRPAMQAINRALMTTIAACGDINRNVMCSSLPTMSKYHKEVHAISQKISDHLLPCTTAYHEIWLADENQKKTLVAGDAIVDHEPLYGPTYLPRKFKITIAIPPHNDTDVYAHDVGLIAIKSKNGKLEGFNVLAGGGMGVTHSNKKTYPQVGRMFGYVPANQAHIVCEKIMLVQRDHGDRKNRKHARMKYTIDDMGVDVFIGKVEELLGWKFEKPRPFKFDSNIDTFGWVKDETGLNHFTFFIENGRIEDTADFPMKTGLVEIAKVHKGEFRLTGNQHLILSNVTDTELPKMKALMAKYKLDNTNFSGLRLSSSACVAFPTCGLAMAESERYLPELISKLESTIEESGLRQDSIVMRMTGCPNGCARPWLAEVAFVGKALGAYNMYLGGGYHGNRLNKLYRASIKEDEILEIMRPLVKRYAAERESGERFGDFVIRYVHSNPSFSI
jgi:sulfite reductase (NADPH) hemoprotein beta-component